MGASASARFRFLWATTGAAASLPARARGLAYPGSATLWSGRCEGVLSHHPADDIYIRAQSKLFRVRLKGAQEYQTKFLKFVDNGVQVGTVNAKGEKTICFAFTSFDNEGRNTI